MLTYDCGEGITLTVTPFQDGILRLRAQGYDGPVASLLERYGFLEPLPVEETARVTAREVALPGGITLALAAAGGWQLRRGGQVVAEALPTTRPAVAPTVYRNTGCQLDLRMADGEKFIGFGDQTRTQFLLNGQRDALWVRYPVKHIPVPFFMSSRGYGIFFNTTRKLRYDVGATDPAVARFTVPKDFLDIFLITGEDYQQIIEKYTRLTGGRRCRR